MGIIDETYCGDNDQWFFPALAMRDTQIHVNDRICQFRIMSHQPQVEFEMTEMLGGKDRGRKRCQYCKKAAPYLGSRTVLTIKNRISPKVSMRETAMNHPPSDFWRADMIVIYEKVDAKIRERLHSIERI